MIRDRKGRFAKKRKNKVGVLAPVVFGAILVGMYGTFIADAAIEPVPVEYHSGYEWEPKTVLIGTKIDWTEERIEKEVREVFHEAPELAVKIALCESNLKPDAVGPTRDFGVMQIHEPTWHQKAIELGFDDYKTNPEENIQMARYIYENAGSTFTPWVCYTQQDDIMSST